MDKLSPFNHFNPSLTQNLLSTHKSHRSHLSTPLPFALTQCQYEAPLLSSVSFPFSEEIKTLNSVKVKHAQMIKMSNKKNLDSMGESFITHYLKFRDYRSAAIYFFLFCSRNHAVWNSFLDEFRSFNGDPREIIEVFCELHCKGMVLNSKLLALGLKFCAFFMDLSLGIGIHACLIKKGFDLDVYSKRVLINFYGSCGLVQSANQMFNEMPERNNKLLWNEIIMVNLKNEKWMEGLELFRIMQLSFLRTNSSTIVKLLQACGKVRNLYKGKQIHGYILRNGFESNLSICNSLIRMYSKNDGLEFSRRVFDSMEDRNLSSWNSIISSYASLGCLSDAWNLFGKMESADMKPDIITWNCLLSGHSVHSSYKEALNIFRRMLNIGFKPNSASISSVFQAVIELGLLNSGKELHGHVIRHRLEHDIYVGTSLIDMYLKNNSLPDAVSVFNTMRHKSIFSWNSLISGYSFKGLFEEAEKLLNRMKNQGYEPDLVTWNSLVSGYSKWGQSRKALSVIRRIKNSGLKANVISWTALISGCSQNENFQDSIKFFIQMQEEGIWPNSGTISSLLQACAGPSLLQNGGEIHSLAIRHGLYKDLHVESALIDMYSKSGNLKSAHKVFTRIENKSSLASWNCMIMGYAIHNLGEEAISLFDELIHAGLRPDAITFTALLSACKNSGLVDQGWRYFDKMSGIYDINPTIEHYSCMVDLLGRASFLDEAWDLIKSMPVKPDSSIWGAVLSSCRNYENTGFAKIAAKHLFELEPYNSANYILLMNLYAVSNRWDDMEDLKDLMNIRGIKIRRIWSWIRIDRTIHVFFADEKNPHFEIGRIYFKLYHLVKEIKEMGYVPDINCVYQNIEKDEKEKVLLSHTEKLAITYGLLKTKGSNKPIRVIKNTRICSDCHVAAKYISQACKREIILRDGARFHHFREGKCSCNDNW